MMGAFSSTTMISSRPFGEIADDLGVDRPGQRHLEQPHAVANAKFGQRLACVVVRFAGRDDAEPRTHADRA